MTTQYNILRDRDSFADSVYVMIVADPPEGPETNWATYVPDKLRSLGPWYGYRRGELSKLKPVYREMLEEIGFVVLWGIEQAAKVEVGFDGDSHEA